ncbi:hypothetical protein HRbin01_01144 [archaeon HR01]|nr:hypothetical protein HRbin01_01144 [archaeon HR01]
MIPEERIRTFHEMEKRYRMRDVEYFKKLTKHPDMTIRARATCILAEIGGRECIPVLAEVLLKDENPIVRHEASYSLGQLGFKDAIPYLVESVLNDPHFIVRHESAIALGVIGRKEAEEALMKALEDESQEVRDSALIALSNIAYCEQLFSGELDEEKLAFAKKTGG